MHFFNLRIESNEKSCNYSVEPGFLIFFLLKFCVMFHNFQNAMKIIKYGTKLTKKEETSCSIFPNLKFLRISDTRKFNFRHPIYGIIKKLLSIGKSTFLVNSSISRWSCWYVYCVYVTVIWNSKMPCLI